MERIKKNEYKFRTVCAILYLIFSLPGLSILFFFPPRYLLFNKKSKNFQNIFYLYKTFVKSIYENLNKPFIKNVTISNTGYCPPNFEVLFIENEHFGKFSKFYGNNTVFCVEKFHEKNYNYEYLLSLTNSSEKINECKEGTRKCGNLNKLYNFSLCVDNDIHCPKNVMIFGKNSDPKADRVEFSTNCFFSTSNDLNEAVMVDIEIKNNYRLCLEKFPIEEYSCEIYDNNQCLISNGFKRIESQKYGTEISLSPSNLAKWNLDKDYNINHEFCKEDSFFQIFETGYINFTYQNLLDFKAEFPLENEINNSLYEACNAFKSSDEFDILYYLISFILLCWSVTHFVIQLLYLFDKMNLGKCYLWNGIILFFFKLFSYFGMIIYNFFYYLKIKKVYLILVDFPRNQVLNLYKSTRNTFITKEIIFGVIGFVVISIDLIIFFFTIIFKFRIDSMKEEKKLNDTNINENENEKKNNSNIFNNILSSSQTKPTQLKSIEEQPISNKTNSSNSNNDNNINSNNNNNNNANNASINLENPYNEIKLTFIFNNDSSKVYKVNAQKGDLFSDVIKKLKAENSELSEMNMKVFYFGSKIINIEKTILENKLSSDTKIAILCD